MILLEKSCILIAPKNFLNRAIKIINFEEMDRKPNFLIVGAAKSGTTSLCHYLSSNPEIYIPKEKELFFFSKQKDKNIQGPGAEFVKKIFVKDFDEYIGKYFKNTHGFKAVGEGSTDYLYYFEEAIKSIENFIGNDVKIIILLRDPIEACVSRYKHSLMRGWENEDFEVAINSWEERRKRNWLWDFDYVGTFMYFEKVNAFLSNFKMVKIFLYDDLVTSKSDLLKECYSFLNVRPIISSRIESIRYQKSGRPMNKYILKWLDNQYTIKDKVIEKIPDGLHIKLMQIKGYIRNLMIKDIDIIYNKTIEKQIISKFSEDVKKLEKLIGRSLSHWKSYG